MLETGPQVSEFLSQRQAVSFILVTILIIFLLWTHDGKCRILWRKIEAGNHGPSIVFILVNSKDFCFREKGTFVFVREELLVIYTSLGISSFLSWSRHSFCELWFPTNSGQVLYFMWNTVLGTVGERKVHKAFLPLESLSLSGRGRSVLHQLVQV